MLFLNSGTSSCLNQVCEVVCSGNAQRKLWVAFYVRSMDPAATMVLATAVSIRESLSHPRQQQTQGTSLNTRVSTTISWTSFSSSFIIVGFRFFALFGATLASILTRSTFCSQLSPCSRELFRSRQCAQPKELERKCAQKVQPVRANKEVDENGTKSG